MSGWQRRIRSTRLSGLRRLVPAGPLRWIIPGVAACLVLAGVLWAVWPGGGGSQSASAVPPHLVSGTVQADVLTPDTVSKLAGTQVVAGRTSNQPPVAVSASPAKCAVMAGPATQSVYGHSWSAFLSATYQDAGGTGDYTVSQVIGIFPDTAKAGAAAKILANGLSVAKCTSAVTKDHAGRATKWSYTIYPITPIAAAWTATQNAGAGWACYHQARLKGTALLQVAICEEGDGQPAASALADALAGKVRG